MLKSVFSPIGLEVFRSLAVIAAAVAAAYFARKQWLTARDKLRLELYEKRLAAYQACRKAINDAFRTDGRLSQDDFLIFKNILAEHEFLFGTEILDFFEDVKFSILEIHVKDANELGDKSIPFSDLEILSNHMRLLFGPYLTFPYTVHKH